MIERRSFSEKTRMMRMSTDGKWKTSAKNPLIPFDFVIKDASIGLLHTSAKVYTLAESMSNYIVRLCSIRLSVYLLISLSVCLQFVCLHVCLSLPLCLSVWLFICLLSACLPVRPLSYDGSWRMIEKLLCIINSVYLIYEFYCTLGLFYCLPLAVCLTVCGSVRG